MFYLRSYGKLGENVLRYSNTIIGDDEKLQKLNVSPFFKHENYLEMENGESDLIEITMKPKKVYDDKPVPMAAAILSNSKLHFLKFIYEIVFRFFKIDAFKLCYCDTDSIAIGLLNICDKKLSMNYFKLLRIPRSQKIVLVKQICSLFYYQL